MAINFSHDVKNEQIETYIIHLHSIEKKQYVRLKKNCLSIYKPSKMFVTLCFLACGYMSTPPKKEIFHQPT